MNICEPFRQTAGDIAKICDANFHHRLVLNIGEAIPWYLCMFLSFSCEWRSSVVQARMCKLGRDPLIFLKILVVIGHVCINWSKVAEGFSVFNAVLFKITAISRRGQLFKVSILSFFNSAGCSQERATAALLAEPGFQLGTLEFLLDESSDVAASPPPEEKKHFSLKNCKYMSLTLINTIIFAIMIAMHWSLLRTQKQSAVESTSVDPVCWYLVSPSHRFDSLSATVITVWV